MGMGSESTLGSNVIGSISGGGGGRGGWFVVIGRSHIVVDSCGGVSVDGSLLT
jgi:hypothetical protein